MQVRVLPFASKSYVDTYFPKNNKITVLNSYVWICSKCYVLTPKVLCNGDMMKLVYMTDSKSVVFGHVGSSPAIAIDIL